MHNDNDNWYIFQLIYIKEFVEGMRQREVIIYPIYYNVSMCTLFKIREGKISNLHVLIKARVIEGERTCERVKNTQIVHT